MRRDEKKQRVRDIEFLIVIAAMLVVAVLVAIGGVTL